MVRWEKKRGDIRLSIIAWTKRRRCSHAVGVPEVVMGTLASMEFCFGASRAIVNSLCLGRTFSHGGGPPRSPHATHGHWPSPQQCDNASPCRHDTGLRARRQRDAARRQEAGVASCLAFPRRHQRCISGRVTPGTDQHARDRAPAPVRHAPRPQVAGGRHVPPPWASISQAIRSRARVSWAGSSAAR